MNKLSLAIGLSSKTIEIPQTEFQRIDMGELISQAISMGKWIGISKNELIKDYLNITNSDVIIGYAVNTQEEYLELKKTLIETRYQISEVYFKQIESSQKYQDEYSKHSNWMDYSPDFIKSKEEKYNLENQQLLERIKQDNIAINYL